MDDGNRGSAFFGGGGLCLNRLKRMGCYYVPPFAVGILSGMSDGDRWFFVSIDHEDRNNKFG